MRYVGSSTERVEDPRLLTGRGRFLDDHTRPGMLHAYFLRSPYAHARIDRIRADAARARPGVACVLTATDLGAMATRLAPPQNGGLRAPAHGALATDRVRFVGDPVALVVATSRAAAEDAAELVEVDYTPLAPVATIDAALDPTSTPLFDDEPHNVLWQGESAWGDVEAAFARADQVLHETFVQHRHTCVPMECRGGVAEFDPGLQTLTYTISHQNPHAMRMHLAAILGLPAARITVRLFDTGGSFGLKSHPAREDVAVCAAARHLARPVKWMEDRAENLLSAGHARDERVEVHAAITADGELIGLRAHLTMDHGAYPLLNIPLSLFAGIVKVMLPGTLRLRDYAFTGTVVATNKASYVAYRGPWEVETWVRERLLDRIARAVGIDPAEVRRRNLLPADAYPTTMLTGATLEFMTINRTLERAVELAGYDTFRDDQARALGDAGSNRTARGIGLCTYIEPGPGPPDYAQALGFTYEQRSAQRARVKVETDGTITVYTSQQPHGQGHETTLAQLVADELGVVMDQVRIVHGNTEVQPFNLVATGGSRAATLASGAVMGAARTIRAQLVDIAASQLEANPADLDIADGVIAVKGSPARHRTIADIARLAYLAPNTLPASLGQGLDAVHDFDTPPGGWTQSTHVCWVAVDLDTGVVTIPRYLVVEDCGRMINPAIVEGQIRGGVAQGIGAVLYEHAVYDDAAQFLTSTFLDYLVPTACEIPTIEIEHLEGEDQGDVPFRGVGEGGAIGAPAAVTNAIEDALAPLGVRIAEQHLPPSRLLELLHAARR
jgi:carbon-monoxide dehydrogenase large subunit